MEQKTLLYGASKIKGYFAVIKTDDDLLLYKQHLTDCIIQGFTNIEHNDFLSNDEVIYKHMLDSGKTKKEIIDSVVEKSVKRVENYLIAGLTVLLSSKNKMFTVVSCEIVP